MNDKYLIIIDVGHGSEREPGAVANGYKEKDLNLQISKELYVKLKTIFSNVIMTRTDDTYFDLNERANWVAKKAAEFDGKTICLSIHLNAGGGTGAEAIYSIYSDDKLARSIVNKICELGIPFRNVYSRQGQNGDYYCMHRQSGKAQTVIVESLFLDNPNDIAILRQSNFIESLAQKICDGLVSYVKPELPQPKVEIPIVNPEPEKPKEPHWAKPFNDELMILGILSNDHTNTLDKSATEGFVIAALDKLYKKIKE